MLISVISLNAQVTNLEYGRFIYKSIQDGETCKSNLIDCQSNVIAAEEIAAFEKEKTGIYKDRAKKAESGIFWRDVIIIVELAIIVFKWVL